jgi:polar amino acid transport system substrate-binding protein
MHRAFLAFMVTLAATSALAQEPPLKTGVDGTFAPHAMPNLSGGIQGFNVDLANEIAKRLNRRIVIEATQFSGLVPALQAGTYDFLAAPVTATRERAENLLFTEGYLNTDFQFVVRKDAPEITKLEDLKGKVNAVNKGAAYDSWARELADKIGWTVASFGTNTDAVQAVISGRAHANVAGNTAVAWAAKNNPAIKLSYLYSTGLVWAVPVRKDNVELRRKLDVAIESGTARWPKCTRSGSAPSRRPARPRPRSIRATACPAWRATIRRSTRRRVRDAR